MPTVMGDQLTYLQKRATQLETERDNATEIAQRELAAAEALRVDLANERHSRKTVEAQHIKQIEELWAKNAELEAELEAWEINGIG